MKPSVRLCLGLMLVSSALAFAGCGDDDDAPSGGGGTSAQGGQTQSGGAAAGSQKCEAIAELCHPVDDGDGPLHECHEQSEVGNPSKCSEIYDSCIAQCQAAHDALGAGGGNSGGMSSAGGAEGTAAGASSGGAGGAQ